MPDDPRVRVDVRLRRALESGAAPKELLIEGPAGTGKTFGILANLHQLAAGYAGLRILICRATRVSLSDSVLATYEQDILPADGMESVARGASRRHRQAYVYPNGSEIVPAGMDNPTRIASTAWDVAYVPEAIELDEEGFETIGSRLDRPGRPAGLGLLVADTNPGDPSHWLRKRLDSGQTARWLTAHEANPALHDGRGWTPRGLAYLARLGRLTGTRRKRLKDGLWAAGGAAWFGGTFDPAKHVTPEAEYDVRFPVNLSIDTGVWTGAVWWQVRPTRLGQALTVFADYQSYDRPAFDVARAILGITAERCGGRVDVGRHDPAGGARAGFGGVTIASEFRRAGLVTHPWPKYPGCELAGLNLVESFIATDPPQFAVHPRCVHMIDALTNFKRKKRGGVYIDEAEEHQHPYEECIDALRSGALDAWPAGRVPEPVYTRVDSRRALP